MKKHTKLTIATIVLAGGLAVAGGIQYLEQSNSYDAQLKKEISHMDEPQLRNNIKECDIALERLRQKIDSKETNPEERFEASRAFHSITQERKLLQEQLDKINKKTKTTIHFSDIKDMVR